MDGFLVYTPLTNSLADTEVCQNRSRVSGRGEILMDNSQVNSQTLVPISSVLRIYDRSSCILEG